MISNSKDNLNHEYLVLNYNNCIALTLAPAVFLGRPLLIVVFVIHRNCCLLQLAMFTQ